MLDPHDYDIRCYGKIGNDKDGDYMMKQLKKTKINTKFLEVVENGITPSVVVMSDPAYNNGAGERLGIGELGEVENITGDILDEDFFKSDYCIFGGSAFTWRLH